MSTAQITIPLDIPDVRILQTQLTAQGEYIITVESTLTSAVCHRCGRMIRRSYGTDDWVTVQHLPILPARVPAVSPEAVSLRHL